MDTCNTFLKAGGIAALDVGIDDRLTQLISTEGGQGFGIWWVVWFLIACLMSASLFIGGTARNEMYARLSIIGTVIKRFCTLGWGLAGLFAIALYGGIMTVVSYLTKQHNQRAVNEYYVRLDTPLGFEHKLRERGFREDDLEELDREVIHVDERDRQTSGRLILVDLLRIPKLIGAGEAKLSDYKVDLIGLIASIAFVILFIAGVQWLGKLF